MLVEGAPLRAEDPAVLGEQVLALHALAPRPGADEEGEAGVAERLVRIVGDHEAVHQRIRAVVDLHHHAPEGGQRGRDLEELEDDRLVRSQHLPRGDPKEKRVRDLTGRAGHRDPDRRLHDRSPAGT